MIKQDNLAGGFTLPGTSMTVNRMGYGDATRRPRWQKVGMGTSPRYRWSGSSSKNEANLFIRL